MSQAVCTGRRSKRMYACSNEQRQYGTGVDGVTQGAGPFPFAELFCKLLGQLQCPVAGVGAAFSGSERTQQ
eukprot:1549965-Lingulodinium_polyedra.AAC.1